MYVEVSKENDFVTFSLHPSKYIFCQKYFSFDQQADRGRRDMKRSIFIRLLLLFPSLELNLF